MRKGGASLEAQDMVLRIGVIFHMPQTRKLEIEAKSYCCNCLKTNSY